MTSACVPTRHTGTVVSQCATPPNPPLEATCSVYARKAFGGGKSTQQIVSLCPADSPAGILNDDGTLDNDASCLRLAEVAVAYARAGKPVMSFYILCICLPCVQENGNTLSSLSFYTYSL